MSGEGGLDLPQLDAEAPHLHLVVDAAQELDLTVRPPPHQIAGAVEAGAGLAERVGEEALGRELGAAEIAARQAVAADRQLARHAGRHRLEPAIDDVDGGVGDGLADRHGLPSPASLTSCQVVKVVLSVGP